MVTLIDLESWIAACIIAHAESPEGWRNRLLSCMSDMSVFSLLYWNHRVCAASLLMCDSHHLYPSMWLPWKLDLCSPASIWCFIDPWWSLWHSLWALNSLTRSLDCQRFFVFFYFISYFTFVSFISVTTPPPPPPYYLSNNPGARSLTHWCFVAVV